MKSHDHETLIVAAGVFVLAVSLLLPMVQKFAAEHDVREVATRAAEVRDKLMSSAETGKPLRVRVSDLVDGLSPDAALAEAEMRDDRDDHEDQTVAPAASEMSAVTSPPVGDAGDSRDADEVRQVATEECAPAAVAPRDGAGDDRVRRAGASHIWRQ